MTFVTHPSQFKKPDQTKVVRIDEIPGLEASDGTPAKLFARKLKWSSYRDYQRSLLDENGQRTLKTWIDNELKYVAAVICDKSGNLIWPSPEECVAFLEDYDQSVGAALFAAALKANTVDPKAVDRAEKNSGRTSSGSENGISASTSESLTPVS